MILSRQDKKRRRPEVRSMNTIYEQRSERLFIGGMTDYTVVTHVHALAEVIVVTRGEILITIDEVQYRLTPGDAAVVFPLVPHSFDQLSADSKGVTGIFPPDIIPEYAGTFHGLQPESPLLPAEKTGNELRDAVARLVDLKMEENLPMCVAYLHVMMAGILHSLAYRPVYDYSERELGPRIISYISDHAFEEITLENASRALGISASHLSHFFSERLHTNFRRFINAIRIEKARLLMRDPNLTLTEICDACGYTNMRTFRRAFQQELGCLPSDHLNNLRNRVTGE